MPVTLAFIGDVMLGRGVNAEIARRAPESFWGDTLPVLRSADAVIANLECAITRHLQPWSKTPKVFHFRADPPAVEVLRAGNIRCVTLANNHTLDFEEQGLLDTLKYLDDAGIAHVGAGRNLAEARAPVTLDVAGVRIGIGALTDNEPAFAAGEDRPGTNYAEIPSPEAFDYVEETSARVQGADLFVLGLHWGPNMVLRPPAHFRAFAEAALDRGVDLIYGHSAHLFHGVQKRDRKLILYDTGDFLDDYAVDPVLRNDWSFIFLVEVEPSGIAGLRMVPVRLGYAEVNLAKGDEREAILERMERLSGELP